jgi:hypothetical protein
MMDDAAICRTIERQIATLQALKDEITHSGSVFKRQCLSYVLDYIDQDISHYTSKFGSLRRSG